MAKSTKADVETIVVPDRNSSSRTVVEQLLYEAQEGSRMHFEAAEEPGLYYARRDVVLKGFKKAGIDVTVSVSDGRTVSQYNMRNMPEASFGYRVDMRDAEQQKLLAHAIALKRERTPAAQKVAEGRLLAAIQKEVNTARGR